MAMATSGGSLAMALKYENGARFVPPVALRVDTNAIGRGITLLAAALSSCDRD